MNSFFNPDSPVMRALSRLFDLMILNLLTLLLCIPVVTAGASISAMHSILIQMDEDREGYIIRTFFAKFKENFRQATPLWILMLVVFALLFVDFRLIGAMDESMAAVMQPLLIVLLLLILFIAEYIFPLAARYENTLKGTLSASVRLAIGFFPKTVAMTVINAAVLYFSWRYLFQVMPVIIMYCFSGPAFLCSKLYMPIFHKIEENMNIGNDRDSDDASPGAAGDELQRRIEERRIPGRDK